MCFFFFKGTGGTDLIMTNGSNQQILEQTGIAPLFLSFFFPFNQFLLFITFGAYAKLFRRRRRRRSGGMKEAKVKSSHPLRARQQSSSSCTAFACVCVCLSYQ
jgi:hypothetical protein